MKNKIQFISIFLALILTLIVDGCKEDKNFGATDEELNRSFMAVFRSQGNTGKSGDPLGCQVVNTNDMYLTWNGINGAAGYRIQMKIQSGSWDVPSDILMDTTVGPDVLKMTVEDLQYSTKHNFAIQTLSPLGEAYNSKWYGYGDGGHNDDRAEWEMGVRLGVPKVLMVRNVTETTMRIYYDLTVTNTDPLVLNPSFKYNIATNKFILHKITIKPSSNSDIVSSKTIPLTQEDLDRGYIDVDGLTSNTMYIVNGLNDSIIRYWDRLYNTVMVRMAGVVGDPILIPHIVDTSEVAKEYDASRLDTILNNYVYDNSLAEGTIFLLEGGKKYYFGATPILAKGLVLKSNDPNNKAIVYMGLGWSTTSANTGTHYNFSLGRNATPGEIGGIEVKDVIISDIEFQAPFAFSYFNMSAFGITSTTGSGNYFVNQYSGAMQFTCSKFMIQNCNFQGMVRGFIRTQGTNQQNIENITIDKCLFHDCGYYDANGRGYPFITGSATNPSTNIFKNVVITNNSFIGISYDLLMRETANLDWATEVVWNVTIENNTFLNAFALTSGRYLIQHRYPPANSRYTIRKNLFIGVKAVGDERPFFQCGMDFYTYRPGVSFNVADNYSTSATSADGTITYWTSAEIFGVQPFSSTSRGAGYSGGIYNDGGLEATKVITGPIPIAPENLMVDPYPKGKKVGTVWATDSHLYNVDGLKFKNTQEVHDHPIYTLGIGDPRWR